MAVKRCATALTLAGALLLSAGTGSAAASPVGPVVAKGAGAARHSASIVDRSISRVRKSVRAEWAKHRRALQRKRDRPFLHLPGGVSLATLNSIAACESGGNPAAVGGGGTYRGKYQFDQGTWSSVGGHGDPVAASEAEQDYRAALLYSRSGSSPWPVCG